MSSNVVIAGYARTPFTFAHKGALARTRPDLICGCAMPEGEQGLNVGRLIGLLSELPVTVAGATINRFCGSSMNAIHMAAGNIAMGAGEVFVCAGVESMTRVPVGGYNPMPNPSLAEGMPGAYMSMGETAENLVEKYQVTRDEHWSRSTRSPAMSRKNWRSAARPRRRPRRPRDASPTRSCRSKPVLARSTRMAASAPIPTRRLWPA
jgi:acetyl-CoA acyltransferase